MNDFSTTYVRYLADRVTARFPSCFVTMSSVGTKDTRLPALYVSFSFPSPTPGTEDSSGREVWTRTSVSAQAFSGTSLQEARAIIEEADAAMYALGFRRSNLTEVPNADMSIRRMAATWRASVDANGTTAAW